MPHNLPPGVRHGPDGEFVSVDEMQIDDIEVVSFSTTVGIPASALSGSAAFIGGDSESFTGVLLIDYDDVVDRNEELVMLSAQHRAVASINSTETADGSLRGAVEIAAQPVRSQVAFRSAAQSDADIDGSTFDGESATDDSIDIIGRPLSVAATAPFSDSSSGVGGGGAVNGDSVEISMAPAEFGRWHPRDELYANGYVEVDNVDDSGVHMQVSGQHVYAVLES